MNICRELSHIVLFQYCSHSDSRPVKQWKIWIMFKNLTFHHYSRHFWGPLFGFRKRYNHENNENIWWKVLIFIIFHKLPQIIIFCCRYDTSKTVKIMKIWLKKLFFHNFSQATSDWHFLGSLFDFRKRYKHENNKDMFKTFHRLLQTVTFWGRYLASKSVKTMKRMKIWLNETHFS